MTVAPSNIYIVHLTLGSYTVLRADKTGAAIFYLRSDGQYILLGATVMVVFFVD
jgi:hypothetical protein